MVIDPFLGSGTTGVAATLEGRQFKGSEINRDFAAMSQARILQATVDEAVNN